MIYYFKIKAPAGNITITSDEIPMDSFEAVVLNFLLSNGKATKPAIMRGIEDIGSHEKFEHESKETTLRKIQQTFRNLREKNVPVMTDIEGAWIATDSGEIKEFCNYLEAKAYTDIRSMLWLRGKMLRMIQRETRSLFDGIVEQDRSEKNLNEAVQEPMF